MRISPQDAKFLTNSLKHLPCDDEFNLPVTLDLNGRVAVRGQADGRDPTELVLTDSTAEGAAVRLSTNRNLLARAVKLGFRHVHLYGPESRGYCCDENRAYVWALLGEEGEIAPTGDTERIESPTAAPASRKNDTLPQETNAMSKNRISPPKGANSNGDPQQNGAAEVVSVDALIEKAEVVKAALRESAAQVTELVTALKRHRRQSKTLQSALLSIRQLQAIDA